MSEQLKGRVLGAVTVGERGQVVIPAELRKIYKIHAGDKLIVFAKSAMISLVPADEFSRFLSHASAVMEKIGKKTDAHG